MRFLTQKKTQKRNKTRGNIQDFETYIQFPQTIGIRDIALRFFVYKITTLKFFQNSKTTEKHAKPRNIFLNLLMRSHSRLAGRRCVVSASCRSIIKLARGAGVCACDVF